MKNLLILISFLTLSTACISQDTLFKKVGDPIICKIIEINEEDVKYKNLDNLDGPSYTISAAKIDYIRLQNGTEHRFNHVDLLVTPPDNQILKKKNVVKIAPLSPLFGNINVGFEHVQKFGLHWEGEVGIIGIGNTENLNRNENGVWIYGGPKMLLRKETYVKGERYYHYLHGTYFRPEIGFEYQTGTDVGYTSDFERLESNYTLTHFGLIFNVGKQWVLADILTLDLWAGIGMASNNLKYDRKEISSDMGLFNGVRSRSASSSSGNNGQLELAGNAGLKLGFIF